MHDLLVDRRADRVTVAAHHLEVRLRAAGDDESGCRGIQFTGRHTRRDQRASRVERRRGDQAGLDHRPQLGGRLVDRAAQRHELRPRPSGSRPRASSAAITRVGDLVERADAVDLVDDPPLAVHAEDRRRLALVDRETVRDDLFGVVGATLLLRAQREAGDALVARHAQLDDGVQLLAASREERVEVANLAEVARVAVEQEAAGGVGLRQAVAHDRAGQLVRDQVAGLDDRLDLPAEIGACRHRTAEHIAGGDRRDAERLRDADALGALAGALGPDDEQPGRAPSSRQVTAEVPRSGAAAAGHRSASRSRDRHRR